MSHIAHLAESQPAEHVEAHLRRLPRADRVTPLARFQPERQGDGCADRPASPGSAAGRRAVPGKPVGCRMAAGNLRYCRPVLSYKQGGDARFKASVRTSLSPQATAKRSPPSAGDCHAPARFAMTGVCWAIDGREPVVWATASGLINLAFLRQPPAGCFARPVSFVLQEDVAPRSPRAAQRVGVQPIEEEQERSLHQNAQSVPGGGARSAPPDARQQRPARHVEHI